MTPGCSVFTRDADGTTRAVDWNLDRGRIYVSETLLEQADPALLRIVRRRPYVLRIVGVTFLRLPGGSPYRRVATLVKLRSWWLPVQVVAAWAPVLWWNLVHALRRTEGRRSQP